ncbi:MAG: hypothetical protein L3J41_01825 [Melioribacteraceae bacterium]|nr:hypothetical protein [Melioribacteraceae bacterium]
MWNLIKAELKYNRLSFLVFSIIVIIIQGIEIIQKVLNHSNPKLFINSNNLLFLLIFFFIITIYQNRMKENQIRFLSLLPISRVSSESQM